MKLLSGLTVIACVSLGACAEKSKSDKAKEQARATTGAATTARSATGAGSGSANGSARRAPDGPLVTGGGGGAPPGASGNGAAAGAATIDEARPALTASLTPIADKIEEAMTGGCMQGADRVAALFNAADDKADELHVMMRDPALRAQLAEAIKARQDRGIAKAMSRIDTALVACPQAAEQAKKGLERLLQPAIAVPQ